MKKYFLFLLIGLLFCSLNVQARSSVLLDPIYMKDVTVEELKELIDGGESPFITNAEGMTPLHLLAGVNENPEMIKTLVNYGLDVNANDTSKEWTPLHMAMQNPNSAVVEMLIRCGANVNARSETGITPLMGAAFYRNLETVEILIKHGADVSAKSKYGETSLFGAVGSSSWMPNLNLAVIETLIKYGADVNAKTRDNLTPLIVVVLGNNVRIPEAVELLIKHGADVKVKDKNGKTALDYYRDNKNIKHHPRYWDVLNLMYQKMEEK